MYQVWWTGRLLCQVSANMSPLIIGVIAVVGGGGEEDKGIRIGNRGAGKQTT